MKHLRDIGTKVTFMPDDTISDDIIFDYNVLRTRLREMAFLTKGLKISLEDQALVPENGKILPL